MHLFSILRVCGKKKKKIEIQEKGKGEGEEKWFSDTISNIQLDLFMMLLSKALYSFSVIIPWFFIFLNRVKCAGVH